jgi:Chalcone isomerase-like
MNSHFFAHRRRCIVAALSLPFACAQAQNSNDGSVVIAPPLPKAALAEAPPLKALGGGLLRIFGFQIYNAYLWTPNGAPFDRSKPHVLDLHYLRNFSAKQLAERSVDEMRGQGVGHDGVYGKWLAEMQRVFADVKEGDRLTGVVTMSRSAKFFHNGAYRGEIADPAFTDAFFGIWLSEKSSQPRMRDRLLGKPE